MLCLISMVFYSKKEETLSMTSSGNRDVVRVMHT